MFKFLNRILDWLVSKGGKPKAKPLEKRLRLPADQIKRIIPSEKTLLRESHEDLEHRVDSLELDRSVPTDRPVKQVDCEESVRQKRLKYRSGPGCPGRSGPQCSPGVPGPHQLPKRAEAPAIIPGVTKSPGLPKPETVDKKFIRQVNETLRRCRWPDPAWHGRKEAPVSDPDTNPDIVSAAVKDVGPDTSMTPALPESIVGKEAENNNDNSIRSRETQHPTTLERESRVEEATRVATSMPEFHNLNRPLSDRALADLCRILPEATVNANC
jgi:hypothetical protein